MAQQNETKWNTCQLIFTGSYTQQKEVWIEIQILRIVTINNRINEYTDTNTSTIIIYRHASIQIYAKNKIIREENEI